MCSLYYINWESVDLGILKGVRNQPPWIPRDDCIQWSLVVLKSIEDKSVCSGLQNKPLVERKREEEKEAISNSYTFKNSIPLHPSPWSYTSLVTAQDTYIDNPTTYNRHNTCPVQRQLPSSRHSSDSVSTDRAKSLILPAHGKSGHLPVSSPIISFISTKSNHQLIKNFPPFPIASLEASKNSLSASSSLASGVRPF